MGMVRAREWALAIAMARATDRMAPDTGTMRLLVSSTSGDLDRMEVMIAREGPTAFPRVVGVTGWQIRAAATHRLQFSP